MFLDRNKRTFFGRAKAARQHKASHAAWDDPLFGQAEEVWGRTIVRLRAGGDLDMPSPLDALCRRFGDGMDRCEGCWGEERGSPEREQGRFPRGLYFEEGDGSNEGTIVIGLNPGPASRWECEAFRRDEAEPQVDRRNWRRVTRLTHPYYAATRALLWAMGRRGPIWWTEAVKCQSPGKAPNTRRPAPPPPELIRACASMHLAGELAPLELKSWPIVAVHRGAPLALAVMDRALWRAKRVIRVPHYLAPAAALPALVDACKRHRDAARLLLSEKGPLTSETWLPDEDAWWIPTKAMPDKQPVPGWVPKRMKLPSVTAATFTRWADQLEAKA